MGFHGSVLIRHWGNMDARAYFDRKAKIYDNERNSGPIGALVTREKQIVIELLEPQEGESLLDAGCGSGYYSELMAAKGCLTYGVDISGKMIENLKTKGLPGEVANLEDFNLDKTFDKIVCGGALEFVPDLQKTLHAIMRHMHSGSRFVLVYPRISTFGFLYRLFHLSHGVRIRVFSRKKLDRKFINAGLQIQKECISGPVSRVLLARRLL
jgi:ubiquinone/menaquinone biosynthesis C-methylase UbiE